MSEYTCEICGEEPPEFDGTHYIVDGKEFPIFQNEVRGFNGNYDTHDWEEIHKCCGKEFIIYNGI